LITFDFGDTLVSSDPPYLTRIWMGLKELGVERKLWEVEKAYHMADWKESVELLKKKWFKPSDYQHVLGRRLMEELGIRTGRAALLEDLYRWLVGFRPERVMVPGARQLLAELKKSGYKMGVISNNDGRTREKCRHVDIENYFEFILDSTLEGMVKPDPRFFKKALKLAGARPEQVLHIGDLWGSDILGARKSGLWAMWISNRYCKPELKGKIFKIGNIKQALNHIESGQECPHPRPVRSPRAIAQQKCSLKRR